MFFLSAFDLTPNLASGREWLVANGLGGYSSSTAIGMNTRKYHGLLVAPIRGAQQRHVLLSKFEETVKIGNAQFPLSTNSYEGKFFPEGFRSQVGFSFSTHPTFTYSLAGAKLQKSVRMVHGKNAVVASYRLESGRDVLLSIRPLLCLRPIHSDPASAAKQIEFGHDKSGFETKGPAGMRVCASHGNFSAAPDNYFNMLYPAEKERGYAFAETLFSPGAFTASLSRGEELHIAASLEGLAPSEALDMLDRQELRLSHLTELYSHSNGTERTDFGDALALAANSFLTIADSHKGITAGFPWFSEWGRDAMVSLPGLLLSTGRPGMAREVLLSQARLMKEGLLPNFVGEKGEPHYNSADASLWFVNAVREYAVQTGDYQFIRDSMWKHLRAFLSSHIQGNPQAEMDSDCLLRVRNPASTWMDAQIGGKAVTPRKGKPVEINALWHSGLCFIAEAAERFGDRRTAAIASETADNAFHSFQKFVAADEGRLFDVIEPNDASLRPNQIFAVSLPHSPLNELQKKHVLHTVRSHLYTPLGLRSLSQGDPRYHEKYSGSPEQRDSAYHQGAIWPWLLGAFYDAQLAVYPGSERQVLSSLRPFYEAMGEGCIGTLPELYEPATMKPAGAVSQAWSVAEILRIYTKVKRKAVLSQEERFEKAAMIV